MGLKVVLDTNCVVSALIFSRQKMIWLRNAWQTGEFSPVVSKETATELIKVLSYPKFRLTKNEQTLLLADFLPYTQTQTCFDVPPDLPSLRDPADQMFLSLAVASKADALVTGDQDLLVIKQTFISLPIMTLTEFEPWLQAHDSA